MGCHLLSNSIKNGARITSYFLEYFGFSAKIPTKIAASIPPSQARTLLFSPVFGKVVFLVSEMVVVGVDAGGFGLTFGECPCV